MNILPFIFTFLFIFGIFSMSYFQRYQSFHVEQESYQSSFHAFRDSRNQEEEKNYNKKKPKKKKNSKSAKKKNSRFYIQRDHFKGSEQSKINITSLIKEEKTYPLLYDVALRYMEKAYGHTYFLKDKRLIKIVLDAFLAKAKHSWKEEHLLPDFQDLYPDDPKLTFIFYKMLRGTHYYDLNTQEGFSPLSDLFKFDTSHSRPIQFTYAPSALLEVLLGKDLKETICAIEKASGKLITKNEFEQEFNHTHHPQSSQIKNLLFHKENKNLQKTTIATDEKNKVTVKL